MGKGSKPEECKRSGRRIQKGIWKREKKNGRKSWEDSWQNYYVDRMMESLIGSI